jgi:short-chain Z-isoprenyl diphosphate synthase
MKEVLYYLYERRLLRQMRTGPMPTHIGIVLDGNRRMR